MTRQEYIDNMQEAKSHLELGIDILQDLDLPEMYDIIENMQVACDDLAAEIERDIEPDFPEDYQ